MPSFVSISTPVALTTTGSVAYPAGFSAGDMLLLGVSSDDPTVASAAALAAGFQEVPSPETGGGGTVKMWFKTASGSESGTVAVTSGAGTWGVGMMAAYQPTGAGVLAPVADSSGVDADSTSTTFSVTGASMTVAIDDLLVFWSLFVATGGTFTSGASGISTSHPASGTNASRVNGRSGGNLIQYNWRDRIFSAAGTGSPTVSGTANGANASGPANMILFREVTPISVSAGSDASTADATHSLDSTVTNGSGTPAYVWSVTSGPSASGSQFSSTTAADPVFTFGGGAGVYVLQVMATDLSGTATDSVTITYTGSANTGPVADAGDPQVDIEPFRIVTLSGSDSDSDGTVVSRLWEQTSGTSVSLSGATTATATFEAPGTLAGETLGFTYTVTDDGAETDSDTTTVTVLPVMERAAVGGSLVPVRIRGADAG